MGNFTYHGNQGVSSIDYIICDQVFFQQIDYFIVKSGTYLSDHCQIVAWLKTAPYLSNPEIQPDPKPLEQLPTHFIWDESSSSMFKLALDSPDTRDLVNDFLNHDFEETQFGVDIAVQKFQNILLNAAKRSLKRKVKKRRCRLTNIVNKKWFDKECRFKRHAIRKVANAKRKEPFNIDIRSEYHNTLKEYRKLLKEKQQIYKNSKLNQLAETNIQDKSFWSAFKTLPEEVVSESPSPVTQAEWIRHFRHSAPSTKNLQQRATINKLKHMEKCNSSIKNLDYRVTFPELKHAIKKLKNTKSSYSDLIKNEMLKASYDYLSEVYLKLFNLILNIGIYPSIWSEGIITPIFKAGNKSDPGNYRGICVSSCLGKLFPLIINERLLKFVESNNLLHPSQIGFKTKRNI